MKQFDKIKIPNK